MSWCPADGPKPARFSVMTGNAGHLLVAHGSSDARWRAPFEELARQLAVRHPACLVALSYLEKCPPDVPAALADLYYRGCRHIRVSPLFLSHGAHLTRDLPDLLCAFSDRHPDLVLVCDPALGERPDFQAALLAVLA
ncbi:CbiX/SirB N-terminal domain-containing protein [Acidiferrobacter sp.]|uniref:sirohydrochlorin chelatase n=1 Tax=Acidiferrobacter sp. TaxID=1872107 RepID=UPI00261FA046|nr:CbiX/SirB N-terminal domain-containing protein [Acidiferrobacter sp.]